MWNFINFENVYPPSGRNGKHVMYENTQNQTQHSWTRLKSNGSRKLRRLARNSKTKPFTKNPRAMLHFGYQKSMIKLKLFSRIKKLLARIVMGMVRPVTPVIASCCHTKTSLPKIAAKNAADPAMTG